MYLNAAAELAVRRLMTAIIMENIHTCCVLQQWPTGHIRIDFIRRRFLLDRPVHPSAESVFLFIRRELVQDIASMFVILPMIRLMD